MRRFIENKHILWQLEEPFIRSHHMVAIVVKVWHKRFFWKLPSHLTINWVAVQSNLWHNIALFYCVKKAAVTPCLLENRVHFLSWYIWWGLQAVPRFLWISSSLLIFPPTFSSPKTHNCSFCEMLIHRRLCSQNWENCNIQVFFSNWGRLQNTRVACIFQEGQIFVY